MRILTVLLLAALTLAAAGCSRGEPPAPQKSARISATKDFERYFGPAPTTSKGTCYGFVIYFPLVKEPGKVTPFPFFSFDEASLKKVAMQRMIGGMDERSYAGEFLQLFPPGSRLLSLSAANGVTRVEFSKELRPAAGDPARKRALYNAITLTLMQFGGVSGVRIQSDGADLFPPSEPAPAAAVAVVQPSVPRLLNIIAMRQSAGAPVQEVDALFDRPVDIKEFQFLDNDGNLLAGEVFHSMFDMAAVLKPKDPGKFAEGSKVRARYKVVDKMGRSAAGEAAFALQVKLHQD